MEAGLIIAMSVAGGFVNLKKSETRNAVSAAPGQDGVATVSATDVTCVSPNMSKITFDL